MDNTQNQLPNNLDTDAPWFPFGSASGSVSEDHDRGSGSDSQVVGLDVWGCSEGLQTNIIQNAKDKQLLNHLSTRRM